MSETGETYRPDAAAIIAPLTVDAVLRDVRGANVAVPDEDAVRAYLHANADVLPVVRAAGARLRARFGPRTSLSLELYRDPEYATRSPKLFSREAEYTDDFCPVLERGRGRTRQRFPVSIRLPQCHHRLRSAAGRMSVFEWAGYVQVARELLTGDPSEAARRSAVSGAYYGAFNHARRYATQYLAYPSLPGADEHGRILEHLRRQLQNRIADRLEDMRSWRNQCDYDDAVPDLRRYAADAVRNATAVIDTLVFY